MCLRCVRSARKRRVPEEYVLWEFQSCLIYIFDCVNLAIKKTALSILYAVKKWECCEDRTSKEVHNVPESTLATDGQ